MRLNKHTKGLGLGLSIARGIVESQGGTIVLGEGPRGLGTAVAISVPIADK